MLTCAALLTIATPGFSLQLNGGAEIDVHECVNGAHDTRTAVQHHCLHGETAQEVSQRRLLQPQSHGN